MNMKKGTSKPLFFFLQIIKSYFTKIVKIPNSSAVSDSHKKEVQLYHC